MRMFVEQGIIRISPASKYKDGALFNPRTDDELNKHQWLVGEHTTITTRNGKRIPIIGDLKRTVSTHSDYYTLCLSCDFDFMLFDAFDNAFDKCNSCVVIKNPVEFARRLENEAKAIFSLSRGPPIRRGDSRVIKIALLSLSFSVY